MNVDGVGDIDMKVMQETGVTGNVAANDWRAGDTFWVLYTAGVMLIVRNANDLAGIPFEEGDIIYHNGTKRRAFLLARQVSASRSTLGRPRWSTSMISTSGKTRPRAT